MTYKEFIYETDYRTTGEAISFIPEENREIALTKERKAFDIF